MAKTKVISEFYWDACVFLAYVNQEAERLPTIETVIRAAEMQQVRVFTSVISYAEVVFGKSKQDGKVTRAMEKKIDGLWEPGSFVQPLIEISTFVAHGARELNRKIMPMRAKPANDGWKGIRPLDALHLAAAKRRSVKEFHTFDEPLLKLQSELGDSLTGVLGFPIVEPHSDGHIEFPSSTASAEGEAG